MSISMSPPAATVFRTTTEELRMQVVAATSDEEVPAEEEGTATIRTHCSQYKLEAFERLLLEYEGKDRRKAMILGLEMLNIQVFVIEARYAPTKTKLLEQILNVVDLVNSADEVGQKDNDTCTTRDGFLGSQRCLLYKDENERLYNLVLPNELSGLDRRWHEQVDCFSVSRALVAFVILVRSLPCIIYNDNMVPNLKPFYLCLILGLVFSTEISLSSLNSSLMVRGTPSLSAHSIKSWLNSSDGLRKLVLFVLVLASGATGWVQKFFTIGGIVLACLILLANLGSRSWHFLRLKPVQYRGRGSFVYAYIWAVFAGLAMPFTGHRRIMAGGKTAIEHIFMTSMIVACFILISAHPGFQKYLIVGSVYCDQQVLHLSMGLWWMSTTICSLLQIKLRPCKVSLSENEESILVEDQASPVGFRVASLPDFEFDNVYQAPREYLGVVIEITVYIAVALAMGYVYSQLVAQ